MKRAWVLFAGALAVALVSASAAQAISPEEVVAGCNEKSGFGYRFGSAPALDAQVTTDGGLATVTVGPMIPADEPGQKIELEYGTRAGTLYLNQVRITVRDLSVDGPQHQMEDLISQIKQDSRFHLDESLGGEFPYVPSWGSSYTFFTNPDFSAEKRGAMLSVFRTEFDLHIWCIDANAESG